MAKVNTNPVVLIPAIVESTNAETGEYKPYNTTLTFGGRVKILVPVDAHEVTVEKGKDGDIYILTLEGWKSFLRNYTKITQQLYREPFNK